MGPPVCVCLSVCCMFANDASAVNKSVFAHSNHSRVINVRINVDVLTFVRTDATTD